MSTCQYIFKKGLNVGKGCKKKIFKNNFCRNHYINNYLSYSCHNTMQNSLSDSCVRLKKICDMCEETHENDPKFQNKSDFFSVVFFGIKFKNFNGEINGWKLGRLLGEGGFGIVRECNSREKPNVKRAIKIESILSDTILLETNTYKQLGKKQKHVPKIFDAGCFNDTIRFIVIEKLFSFKFSRDKMNKIIDALEFFANFNKTHGDIKFENIMTRRNGDIVLIDLGMCYDINPQIFFPIVSGTILYMSRNAHNGIMAYKNDLESLIYCILETKSKLPWKTLIHDINNFQLVKKEKELLVDKIINKDRVIIKQFSISNNFLAFCQNVFNLQILEKPNYNLLKKICN